MHRNRHCVALVLCVLAVSTLVLAQDGDVKSDHIRDVQPGMTALTMVAAVSGGRGRVAAVVPSGSRVAVRIDDTTGTELFDDLSNIHYPEGERRDKVTKFAFSADGERYAFVGLRSGKNFVVVDGKAGPATAIGTTYTLEKNLVFSPDSKHVGYVIQPVDESGAPETFVDNSQQGRAVRAVVDGVVGPPFRGVTSLQFSRKGRWAYIGGGSPETVIADGQKVGTCDSVRDLQFSADGGRLAYTCRGSRTTGSQASNWALTWRVVVDGKPDANTYSEVREFQWSRDAAHYAYLGTFDPDTSGRSVRRDVVVDGLVKADKIADVSHVKDLSVTASGRYAYVAALTNQREVAVVDGKASLEYRTITKLNFSKDGKHVGAVAASADNRHFMLIDGTEFESPNGIFATHYLFADLGGPLYGYPEKSASDWKFVVEGGPQRAVTDIPLAKLANGTRDVQFSPDGQHHVYMSTTPPRTIVDGKPRDVALGEFHIVQDNRRVKARYSPDSQHVTFVAVVDAQGGQPKHNALFLDHASTPADLSLGASFTLPTFSADSRHFAYAKHIAGASQGKPPRWQVVLNGKPGPIVDVVFPDAPESFAFLSDGRLQVVSITGGKLERCLVDPGKSTLQEFAANAKSTAAATTSAVTKGGTLPATVKEGQDRTTKAGEKATEAVKKIKQGIGGLFGGKKKK